jgi:hypothetical protein
MIWKILFVVWNFVVPNFLQSEAWVGKKSINKRSHRITLENQMSSILLRPPNSPELSEKLFEHCRWLKATSPPQELDVGARRPPYI